MERREFFKNALLAAVALGLPKFDLDASTPPSAYDLVAVKGGEPELMFDKAIQSLGGIGKFVKKGQKVLIKPNIGWDVIPENAANTNPNLVGHVVKLCMQAGAREVVVFDNTCDTWNKCYSNSGIERAVKMAGGHIIPGNFEKYYHEIVIPHGVKLKKTKVHEALLEADVFINMPVLKSHQSARLTISMKNMMGVVWDRQVWHQNDLHQCIADYASYVKKPTLNIVDAYRVMKANGPRGVSGKDVVTMKSLIVSQDWVAADAAASKLFGVEPADIEYIKLASKMGLGRMDLEKLNINRIKI